MHALLLATLISLPLYPVNPIKQDTVAVMNAHFSVGVSAPNGIINTGVEGSARYEFMVFHPFVVRGGLEYRIGSMSSRKYPEGYLHGMTMSAEILGYRGTNRLTGFFGGGLVLNKYFLHMTGAATDSLSSNFGIDEVGVEPALGYRITMGLRVKSNTSVEVNVTSFNTDFLYKTWLSPTQYRQERDPVRFRDFRVTFGYLLPVFDP
jgi:hypothetical protein